MGEPTIVHVPGPRIRLEENDSLREDLLAHVAAGRTALILNFHEVEFVDSSFLGLMIIVLKRVTAYGGDVRICCLQKPLESIFELMRLDRLFSVYETEEAAVQSFK
jgi:anti-anti-sigma factor